MFQCDISEFLTFIKDRMYREKQTLAVLPETVVFEASCFLSFLPSYFQIKNVQNRKFDLYLLFCKTFPYLVETTGLLAFVAKILTLWFSIAELLAALVWRLFVIYNVKCFLPFSFLIAMAMTGPTPCSSMSNHTKERVTMTKVTLENFYSNLIAQHEEREMR